MIFINFILFRYFRLSDENLSEENRALKGEISLLKDQNSSSSFQESELREQVKTLEESLANAETQAKTYYNKVCAVILLISFILPQFIRFFTTDLQA